MARLGDFLAKQGQLLLKNDYYAFGYIAILALIPFASWLSAAVVALITLRKGWHEGFKGFAVAITAHLVLSLMSMPLSSSVIGALIAFLPGYLTAGVLYATASWRVAGGIIVLQALFAIALIHWLTPEFITTQYQSIQMMLKELEREGTDNTIASVLTNQDALNQVVVANYLVGVQAISVLLSVIMSLLVARSVQSRLFYPGGFRQEMLTFRASGFGVILLIIAAISAYQHSPLAISCLPVLVTYYVCAGLSLSFNVLAKDRGMGVLALLLIPLVLLPFAALPLYAIVGALDSLFNFRLHLPSSAGGKKRKG